MILEFWREHAIEIHRTRTLLMQRIVRSSDKWAWEGQVGNHVSTTPLPPVTNP